MMDHDSEHLHAGEITRFLDRAVRPDERSRIVTHMEACDDCRKEVVGAARVIRLKRLRRRIFGLTPALAAAAALLVLFLARPGRPDNADARALRGGTEGIPRLGVVMPTEGATVSGDSVRFVWHGAGAGTQYALTVTGTNGSIALSDSTTDTTFVVSVAEMRRGTDYFWYVDALLANAETASTGVRTFSIQR